jgi:hypothetical protein
MPMIYMITLDAHEYIGPFLSEAVAHVFAEQTQRSSYQLVRELPAYAKEYLQRPIVR